MTKHTSKTRLTLPEKVLREAHRRGYTDLLLNRRLVVAVSGGADSLALLHCLLELRGPGAVDTLHVAHIEHGFRGETSLADARFVEAVAEKYGLGFSMHRADVPAIATRLSISPEDAARRVRYSYLALLAEERGAAIAVAHTADDQAETVLMSILRGTGLAGLAGMQPVTEMRFPRTLEPQDKESNLWVTAGVFRPMLYTSRTEIEGYCHSLGLQPRNDATNSEPLYSRNRVRLDLIPYIEAGYDTAIKSHLAHIAEIASAEENLLTSYAGEEWKRLVTGRGKDGEITIDAGYFAGLHIAMQRRLVRYALQQLAGTLDGISFQHIDSIVSALSSLESHLDIHLPNNILFEVKGAEGTFKKRELRGGPGVVTQPTSKVWPLMDQELDIPLDSGTFPLLDGWHLTGKISNVAESGEVAGSLMAHFDLQLLSNFAPLVLRPRRHGDTIAPLGMSGRKTLQDLYVDAKIPRLLRDNIPVVACGKSGEVLWVPGPGGRRSKHAAITPRTTQVFTLNFAQDAI